MSEVLAGQICMFCREEDGAHAADCPYERAAEMCGSIFARYADGGVAMFGARAAIYEDEQERRGARA